MKKRVLVLFMAFLVYSQEEIPLPILQNLNPEELKDQISEINQQSKEVEIEDSLEKENDVDEKEVSANDRFGFSFFDVKSKTQTPVLDIPLQSDYILSFNDELELLLVGNENKLVELRIDLSGTVLIPKIGNISLLNLSLSEANEKISTLISNSYVGTKSYLNVKNPSLKKISVIGAVKNPGTYLVNPFISITEAIKYASGLKENASIRSVEVIDSKGNIEEYDLYDFLIFGDRSSDSNLRNGDTVRVKATSNFVKISGGVHRQMIYEYKNDDSYQDLLNFALGVSVDGMVENMNSTMRSKSKVYTSKVEPSDRVGNNSLIEFFIGSGVFINDRDIFVTGSGVTTGYYSFSENGNFKELLEQLRFSNDIYPFYAVYEQELNSGLTRVKKAFSLSDPSSYIDFKLTKNSRLFFYDRDYIVDVLNNDDVLEWSTPKEDEPNINSYTLNDIKVIPDIFIKNPYYKDMYENDPLISSHLIQLLIPNKNLKLPVKGKLSPRQIYHYFGISEEIAFDKISIITASESFTNAYENIISSDNLVTISIPPIKQNLIEVVIKGEVLNPGRYTVSSFTTLEDLYVLAGGLRESAFQEGIAVFREEVKEKQIKAINESKAILTNALIQDSAQGNENDITAILELAEKTEPNGRIAGEFFADSKNSKKFVLMNGDSILVPANSSTVTVQGEVLNSTSFIFNEDMEYSDYIEASGGFSDFADKRAVFVIKANGQSEVMGSNVFASGKKEIEPGDTIVVPRNLDKLDLLPTLTAATKIISDIAFSAASLNAIQN